MKKLILYVKNIFNRNKFLKEHESSSNFRGKIVLQLIMSASFFALSIINIFTASYPMLLFTLSGCILNLVFAFIAFLTKNIKYCTYSSIIICSVIFAVFVINGGNEGFASLWIALIPMISMSVMDFVVGIISGLFLEGFLMAVLWTPLKAFLLYNYSDQFYIRFPLFYFVAFMLGLAMAVSLQESQYNAQVHLNDLEKITEVANKLAKCDSLTGLANRRCVYETFNENYLETKPYCIVMGDIDRFKNINDTYGHEFGDEVLVTIANYINEFLPQEYIKSRWGGEEFLVIANENIDVVYEKIEILREKIAQHDFVYNNQTIKITITFGIAKSLDANDLNNAINVADSRLYIGKRTTRNCTIKE